MIVVPIRWGQQNLAYTFPKTLNPRMSRYRIDPADELLILTTKRGKPIGQAPREDCHRGKGKTHWAILAVVTRKNGDVILAKRSQYKSVFPNIWDVSVASHVLPGDTPQKTAKRETKEELGIDVIFKPIGAFYYFHHDDDYAENEFCTVLVGSSNDKITPLPEEVSEVQTVSLSELKKRLAIFPDTYSPWMKIAFQKFLRKIETMIRSNS